jgi:hypothetical protein
MPEFFWVSGPGPRINPGIVEIPMFFLDITKKPANAFKQIIILLFSRDFHIREMIRHMTHVKS